MLDQPADTSRLRNDHHARITSRSTSRRSRPEVSNVLLVSERQAGEVVQRIALARL